MNQEENPNQEQQKQKQFFQGVADNIKTEEYKERSLKDLCCFITFLLILLTTFLIGVSVMSAQDRPLSRESSVKATELFRAMGNIYKSDGGLITLSYFMVVLISISLLTGLSYFTECMVYMLVFLPLVLIIALAVVGFVYNPIYGFIVIFFVFPIWIIISCKFYVERQDIVSLIQKASQFVREISFIYVSAFSVFILAVVFILFWSISFVAIVFSENILNPLTSNENGMLAFFILVYIFMTIFLTYVRMFIVSIAVYRWYHNKGSEFFLRSIKYLKHQIGSLTFGTFMTLLLNFFSFILYSGKPSSVFFTCFEFEFSMIKKIAPLRGLSVSIMSITGKDFLESAGIVRYIISQNIQRSRTVQIICELTSVGGTIIATGLPAFIAMLYSQGSNENKSGYELISIGFIISFGAIIISACFVNLISDVVQSLFMVSCLDDHFKSCRIYIEAPEIIKTFPIVRKEGDLPSVQEFKQRSQRPHPTASRLGNAMGQSRQVIDQPGQQNF